MTQDQVRQAQNMNDTGYSSAGDDMYNAQAEQIMTQMGLQYDPQKHNQIKLMLKRGMSPDEIMGINNTAGGDSPPPPQKPYTGYTSEMYGQGHFNPINEITNGLAPEDYRDGGGRGVPHRLTAQPPSNNRQAAIATQNAKAQADNRQLLDALKNMFSNPQSSNYYSD